LEKAAGVDGANLAAASATVWAALAKAWATLGSAEEYEQKAIKAVTKCGLSTLDDLDLNGLPIDEDLGVVCSAAFLCSRC
jgi:hypothetical protein